MTQLAGTTSVKGAQRDIRPSVVCSGQEMGDGLWGSSRWRLNVDGTLTSGAGFAVEALRQPIDRARRNGLRVVLVTGRIGAELAAEFPHIADNLDALVLENGAVVVTDGRTHPQAAPGRPVCSMTRWPSGRCRSGGERCLWPSTGGPHRDRRRGDRHVGIGLSDRAKQGRPDGAAGRRHEGHRARRGADRNRTSHYITRSRSGTPRKRPVRCSMASGCWALPWPTPCPIAGDHADLVIDEERSRVADLPGPHLERSTTLMPPRWWVEIGTFDNENTRSNSSRRGWCHRTRRVRQEFTWSASWRSDGSRVATVCLSFDPEGDHVELGELSQVEVVDAQAPSPAGRVGRHAACRTPASWWICPARRPAQDGLPASITVGSQRAAAKRADPPLDDLRRGTPTTVGEQFAQLAARDDVPVASSPEGATFERIAGEIGEYDAE